MNFDRLSALGFGLIGNYAGIQKISLNDYDVDYRQEVAL